MPRIANPRRALAGTVAGLLLLLSSVTPATAGDELIVQPGDTLWAIARDHGTTVAALAALNNIDTPSLIRIGQRIVLQTPPPPTAAPPAPGEPAAVLHVVQQGETLWAISMRYGTSVEALAAANQLVNPSLIRTGQQLSIPPSAPLPPPTVTTTPPPPTTAPTLHVVQHGETLWAISIRYGTSVEALAAANQLADPRFIRTGQSLVIPLAAPDLASPPSATNAAMPPAMAAKVAAREAVGELLLQAAREFGAPSAFVLAVAWHESGWRPDVVSSAGAVGVMQLIPASADWVAGSMLHEAPAIGDARWNTRAGVRLLTFYLARYNGDKALTLAAYFQGMASVEEVGILESTQPYIASILALEEIFSR